MNEATVTDISHMGDGLTNAGEKWSFTGDVTKSFDSHVKKSVPLYDEGHKLVTDLSDFYIHDGSIAYEIGCSTGELTRKIYEKNKLKKHKIIGIDNQQDMIDMAMTKCAGVNSIELHCDDILSFDYEKSDFIVSYYTIQFIHPKFRQQLFDKIYGSLEWGGALLLFEKVRASDARFQDLMTQCYFDFKLQNGYSHEEILGKSISLRGVLEPFSTEANYDFLQRSGFKDCITVMKYLSFEGILAIK